MNILVTLNKNYLNPLIVLLYSLLKSHPGMKLQVYILHSSLTQGHFELISQKLDSRRCQVQGIWVDEALFADAPVCYHFTQEMYYRIFAARLLPGTIDRILYLDPDMVVINSLEELYRTDFGDNLLVAAASPNKAMQAVHRLRLGIAEERVYFNSGMMLMNLAKLREEQDLREAFAFIERNRDSLRLPDQDLLNSLYGERTIIVNPLIYNLDARYFPLYYSLSLGRFDQRWVERQTAIIHYCGKHKPFKEGYLGALGEYYTRLAHSLGLGLIDAEIPSTGVDNDDPQEQGWIESDLGDHWDSTSL